MKTEFNIGDIVSQKGGFSTIIGKFGAEGRICRIDNDIIWFVMGSCPDELIMSGKLDWQPHNNFSYKGINYCWLIMNKHKDNLIINNLPYFHDQEAFDIVKKLKN